MHENYDWMRMQSTFLLKSLWEQNFAVEITLMTRLSVCSVHSFTSLPKNI